MEELSLATKSFSDKNLIGIGKFGEVYKGLLNDGMLVAIKKRVGAPSPEFVDEVIIIFMQLRLKTSINMTFFFLSLSYQGVITLLMESGRKICYWIDNFSENE